MSRLVTRFAVATATAGALAAVAADPASATSSVAFGAIQYDSPGKDDRSPASLNAEWVTMTNGSSRTVDLAGWTLSDASRHTYQFHLKLGAHRSVSVHTGAGRDTAADVYWGSKAYVWNNDRDTATLRDAAGQFVVSKSWR